MGTPLQIEHGLQQVHNLQNHVMVFLAQNVFRVNELSPLAMTTWAGIGNATAKKILEQRVLSHFTNWKDLKTRVPCIPMALEEETAF